MNASIMSAAISMGLDEDAKPKTVIRTLLGVDEDADIEVRASNVEVMGNEGSVLIEFYQDGVRVGQEGSDEPWVFADGQWYFEVAIDADSCGTS